MGREARADLVVAGPGGGSARVDDDVHWRQVLLAVAKGFADETLQSIALHGVPCGLHTDCEPEAGLSRVVGKRDHQEQRIGGTLALAVDGVELRLVGQSARTREAA